MEEFWVHYFLLQHFMVTRCGRRYTGLFYLLKKSLFERHLYFKNQYLMFERVVYRAPFWVGYKNARKTEPCLYCIFWGREWGRAEIEGVEERKENDDVIIVSDSLGGISVHFYITVLFFFVVILVWEYIREELLKKESNAEFFMENHLKLWLILSRKSCKKKVFSRSTQ